MPNTRAELSFVTSDTAHPKFIMQVGSTPAVREGEWEARSVEVKDARHLEQQPDIDSFGFELVTEAFRHADLTDDANLAAYLDEVEQLVLKRFDARRVHIIDHTFRSSAPANGVKPTAGHVHNDYTRDSIYTHLQRLLGPSSAEAALENGIAQVNVWRPLVPVVHVAPLAIADGASLSADDLVPAQIVYPDRRGEILQLRHNPAQKWFYYPKMTNAEVLLIKGYDSRDGGQVKYAPHSAFEHPETNPSDPPRKSIEVRTLIEFKGSR